jgi:hypothetical protein
LLRHPSGNIPAWQAAVKQALPHCLFGILEVPMHPGFAIWLWMMMSPYLAQQMLLGVPLRGTAEILIEASKIAGIFDASRPAELIAFAF